jgi:hypothetical protein
MHNEQTGNADSFQPNNPDFDFGGMSPEEIVGTVAFARAFAHNPSENSGPELDVESLSIMQDIVRRHSKEEIAPGINDPKKIADQFYGILATATDKLAETDIERFKKVAFTSATSEDPEDRIEIALSDGICQLTVNDPAAGMKIWSRLLSDPDEEVRRATHGRLREMSEENPEHLQEVYGLTVDQYALLIEIFRSAEQAAQEKARMLSPEAQLGRAALQRLTDANVTD